MLTLVLPAAQEVTLNKTDIARREIKEGVSLMPSGLISTLNLEDFASLIRYLEELNDKSLLKAQ